MPVCICPLAKPVPVCIYRDLANTKGKLSATYQLNSARYTQRVILLQTVKSGWSALSNFGYTDRQTDRTDDRDFRDYS